MNKANIVIVIVFCLFAIQSKAQNTNISQKTDRLKLTLLELSFRHMYTVKGSYELLLQNKNKALEAELGYTFYSREDSIKVNGIYVGFYYNRYKAGKGRFLKVFKIQPYYHRIQLNHYLKYDAELPEFGQYFDYRKTPYTKERYGINFLLGRQYNLKGNYFIEAAAGLGIVIYATTVPKDVTQKRFRNGDTVYKNRLTLTTLMSLKIGYAF